MTDAYFYVNIPYHRPATPSFFRLLQRWAGPLLLGTVLATLAWRQDHQVTAASTQTAVAQTAAQPASQPADAQDATSFGGYTAAAGVADDAPHAAATTQPAATTQFTTTTTQPARVGAHPSLVFHNCSVPHMELKKDRNDMISGVASVSSCDEAKVTLWDTSR